jgi:hypothetical protein
MGGDPMTTTTPTLKEKLRELILNEHDEARGYEPTWADVKRIARTAAQLGRAEGRAEGMAEAYEDAEEIVESSLERNRESNLGCWELFRRLSSEIRSRAKEVMR